jgi:hypothetical protein
MCLYLIFISFPKFIFISFPKPPVLFIAFFIALNRPEPNSSCPYEKPSQLAVTKTAKSPLYLVKASLGPPVVSQKLLHRFFSHEFGSQFRPEPIPLN